MQTLSVFSSVSFVKAQLHFTALPLVLNELQHVFLNPFFELGEWQCVCVCVYRKNLQTTSFLSPIQYLPLRTINNNKKKVLLPWQQLIKRKVQLSL